MIPAQKPANEKKRIAALYEYDILDTMPEKDYDDVTKIAADICGMPISLISIIDNNRQWFKSKFGFGPAEGQRDVAFCAHAILDPEEIFIVGDSSKDDRFFDNPMVTGGPRIAFYAGVPLVNPTGDALGTLCVIDDKPNELSKEQKETLKALARQIVANFEIRKKNLQLAAQKAEMEQINSDLARFAYIAAHDIKSPSASIAMCANYLKDNYSAVLDDEGKTLLEMMEAKSLGAIEMINGILRHTQQINVSVAGKETFTFGSLFEDVEQLVTVPDGFSFTCNDTTLQLHCSRSMLLQILLNLTNNAIKYNDKEHGTIHIAVEDADTHYHFSVQDNGIGISEDSLADVFELFSTLGIRDRFNNMGTGIGLSTVKRLVQKMGGNISVSANLGTGSVFSFTVGK